MMLAFSAPEQQEHEQIFISEQVEFQALHAQLRC